MIKMCPLAAIYRSSRVRMKDSNHVPTVIFRRVYLFLSVLSGACFIAFLASCATPYQPVSALGGYREIQLAPDIYRVMFFGSFRGRSAFSVLICFSYFLVQTARYMQWLHLR